MALFALNNIAVRGIASCVPKTIIKNEDYPLFTPEDALKFSEQTGVYQKREADAHTTTADLCYHATEKLIAQLGWEKDSIDVLIFVSQSPDYIYPASSCILQHRLGLSINTAAMDISLGCSGWVYGFSTLAHFLSHGAMKRGLLLTGEITSKLGSKLDKSSYPLFGDAGTATAVEFDPTAKTTYFHLQTDGEGYEAIIIPDGGCRNPTTEKSLVYEEIEEGIKLNRLHGRLNGMDVFAFGILRAPQSVNKVLEYAAAQREDVDYYIFHQANLFMNEKIRKKLKLTEEQVPYSLKDFGNTSSASIPLTITTQLLEKLQNKTTKIIACGFGVGLSWGTILFDLDKNFILCDLIEI